MHAFRSILVDVDPTAANHPAFTEACDLAARFGSRVTLVDVIADVPSRARNAFTRTVEAELIAKRRTALTTLAQTRPDVPVETAVLRGTPAIALVQQVVRGHHDLVVRSHARDLVPGRPHGAVDLQLLRTCPCPVWLVGPQQVAQPPRILAAVDTEADAPGAAELNRQILDVALTLGEAWRASVTVLHAWSLFGEELLRGHMPERELHEALHATERQAFDGLAAFVATFGDRADEVHMECIKGEPRYVIPRFVANHRVDVVVMGTVARTGIAGFLMGNTAEAILRELRGSVFAVKPSRFVTRVAVPEHAGQAATV
jgi:nucleotide-binding universal stress UspA family protein